jgi:hypothetical protein
VGPGRLVAGCTCRLNPRSYTSKIKLTFDPLQQAIQSIQARCVLRYKLGNAGPGDVSSSQLPISVSSPIQVSSALAVTTTA